MSVVPGCEGESDVAAEGKKRGFGGRIEDEVLGDGAVAGVLLVSEDEDDAVAVGGGVGVGENRFVRGSLMALDLGEMVKCVRRKLDGANSYLYNGPKELSMDR